MVRFTTTISLPPECLGFVESFHSSSKANGKKSFSAWVAWVIRNRKHLGAERATEAEKNADMWLWVAYRMEQRQESMRDALKAVKIFHETAWSNRETWGRGQLHAHMMMEMPPVRPDDIPLEGEEE